MYVQSPLASSCTDNAHSMEPMNTASEELREREEKNKFRLGLKGQRNPDQPPKRKRDDEEQGAEEQTTEEAQPQKKKKQKGPKQPNPLSMKKAKNEAPAGSTTKPKSADSKPSRPAAAESTDAPAPDGEDAGPRKRKRKHKPKGDGEAAANVDAEAAAA